MSDDLTPRDVIRGVIAEWDTKTVLQWSEDGCTADVMAALDAAGWSVTRKPKVLEDVRDAEGNYYGKQDVSHDHRTVGDYRAWCYDASEWCYPSDPCRLCKEVAGGDS